MTDISFHLFPVRCYNQYCSVNIFRRVHDTYSSSKTWDESYQQRGKIRNVESRDTNLLNQSNEQKNRLSPKKCQTSSKKTATYIIVTGNIRTNRVKLKRKSIKGQFSFFTGAASKILHFKNHSITISKLFDTTKI